ncbi:glycosyltransferase family 57 protein [Phanerochaete sordida]|uniref:Alpha-1,3-glucosyltransferase n=1 Tax=Phanerochaete sordida TaxID=48140 RepID=A0A9P3GM06_9APHY|nr:glycosyltransferase family 57 protein [Phanerochaete sordida]
MFATIPEAEKPRLTVAASSQSLSAEDHKNTEDTGMARRWTRWMHKQGLRHRVVSLVILFAALVKWCIGLGSYSGQGTPPMFGDYEAQRHWMELTIHLPIREWYTYDLKYWGLDYPPLTAYISWLCGIIGAWVDPSWFALDHSRGIETPASKIYMRATVLACDTLIYVPAIVFFVQSWQGNRSSKTQQVALLTLLLQPGLLLIDFGHFQYNTVMLGLTLTSVSCFAAGHDLLGAVAFVMSLGFKQMALYYAPAIGSYLLAKCLSLGARQGAQLFFQLAATTVATFALLFLPWLPPFAPLSAMLEPIGRIFPFQRGLFEDKVANFWCASNVVLKWRIWMNAPALIKLSAGLTAAGFLPAVVVMLYCGYRLGVASQTAQDLKEIPKPTSRPAPVLPLLPYALLTSSMSFFLFSFQVHEKTILVPLLPLTLLLSGASNNSFSFKLGALVNNVAVFSMWHLLKRDGLALQYLALLILWNRIIGHNPLRIRQKSLMDYLSITVYGICILLHVLETIVPPPSHLPDIYPVLNVLLSTPVFGITWLWSIKRTVEVSWGLGGLGSSSKAISMPPLPGADGLLPNGNPVKLTTPEGVTSSLGLSVGERAAGLRTRSLGHVQGKKSSLRSGSVSTEFD